MDEPFKSLDVNNKQIVMDFFKELNDKEDKTSILVTHDVEEAINLADCIIILSDKPTRVKRIVDNIQGDKIRARKEIEKEILVD